MSLSALAAFIAENRHLPNVPTTEQVDGGQRINMSELQVKLLEKVEELTLAQQQTIEELKARLEALEQERAE